MGESYYHLKRQLEELGYNKTLPVDAVNLVECLLGDLLQTTRSLQHYMNISKDALLQRDSLLTQLEPYKCDNTKLIQENNQLHHDIINMKEEHLKIMRESQRKLKSLTEDLIKKENLVSKLQHDVRDLSLRGLCTETYSSRNRSKRKDAGDTAVSRSCICNNKNINLDKDNMTETLSTIQSLQEKIDSYTDEIILLKNQVEHRDNEIIRLKILLEGGRPIAAITKDFSNDKPENKIIHLTKQVKELDICNGILKKELEKSLEKQHEAMLRALDLADKNKALKDELQNMDSLALKVEDDCNKRLVDLTNEITFLQTKNESLNTKNLKLEADLMNFQKLDSSKYLKHTSENEKTILQKEITDLMDLNRSLQDKILSLSKTNQSHQDKLTRNNSDSPKCLSKGDLQKILEDERRKYEKYIIDVQEKLNETMNLFNCQLKDEKASSLQSDNAFIKELHCKLCESEQKILMLKKENDDLKKIKLLKEDGNKNNFQDIIKHLNLENSELSKENIILSQQLSQYKVNKSQGFANNNYLSEENIKLKNKIGELTRDMEESRMDTHKYKDLYKELLNSCDKLKRDLVFKQKQLEQLQEENCSYKMTNRTGKASSDRLREEYYTLKEQIKKLQSDLIKEKTVASQIKNIQMETERSTTESQNELLSTQKKLSVAKATIENLEKKCKDYQAEVCVLNNDKSNLIENIKLIDKERDKLVLELDQKAENTNMLEQKLKSQLYDISKLENELSDFKRKLNINKISEHKIADFESQISFLNGEILRLTQQYDTAVIENKHMQNSLADANGALKLTRIELEKSRKEVDGLKQQLQHYVAEIRRIEELLSQKEAERSDMLEHYASLSVEANILENTNHSLESESASKSFKLQSYVSKIQGLEEKLIDKDREIDSQSSCITSLKCKISSLEQELRLVVEEKSALEQNIEFLKKMCRTLQSDKKNTRMDEVDSELKLYENRIKSLSNAKGKLESEKKELAEKVLTTENLLSNARREIIELKLTLQDATSETRSLQERVSIFSRRESDINENPYQREELALPLMLEDTLHENSNEDDDSSHIDDIQNKYCTYRHGSTL